MKIQSTTYMQEEERKRKSALTFLTWEYKKLTTTLIKIRRLV